MYNFIPMHDWEKLNPKPKMNWMRWYDMKSFDKKETEWNQLRNTELQRRFNILMNRMVSDISHSLHESMYRAFNSRSDDYNVDNLSVESLFKNGALHVRVDMVDYNDNKRYMTQSLSLAEITIRAEEISSSLT